MDLFDETIDTSWLDEAIKDTETRETAKSKSEANELS